MQQNDRVWSTARNHDLWLRRGQGWRVAPMNPLERADPAAVAAAPADSLEKLGARGWREEMKG